MKNILLVQTGFIGDVILSSPVISALKKLNPESEISLLTTPAAADLYRSHKDLKEVLVFDKRKTRRGFLGLFKMASELKSMSYDVVYSLHKSSRTSILMLLSGIKERYSFKESKLNFVYTKVAVRSDFKHDVLRNLAILRVHDLNPEDYVSEMSLGQTKDAKEKASEIISLLKDKKKVVIAPGSVWATKRLPVQTFLEVAVSCLRENYAVIFIGSTEDKELGDFLEKGILASDIENKAYVNAIGSCSLSTSAEIIRASDIVVSNDSSPLHLASATQTPVVAVFCATVPEQGFGPWMVPNRIVEIKGLKCKPCGRHGGNVCPTGTHACQLDIQSIEIMKAVKQLLNVQR